MIKRSEIKGFLHMRIGFIKWMITACLLIMILFEKGGYACCVNKVDMWVGDSETAASTNEDTSVTVCHCSTVYFYAEATVGAGTGSSEIIVWQFDFDGDGATDETKYTDNGDAGTYDKSASHTYASGGEYTPKVTVDRAFTTCTPEDAECTVTAVEILSVETDPSDQYVACINEDVKFKATTSSGSDYDLISWSGGGDTQDGGQTFTTSWDSGSTGEQTVEAKCDPSCPVTIDIEVIDGLTVIPSNAYVCTEKTKTFEVWACGATGEAENVTSSAEFDSSIGTMNGATLTGLTSPSSSERADWVEASYDGDTDECELTVVQVEIEAIDRVPPGGTKDVKVTVLPSLTGAAIGLEAVKTSGTSGSATLSHSSISSTTTVAVTGGAQTSAGDAGNVSLIATLDECDNECECDDEPFTVCAHPTNFRATACNAKLGWDYYGLEVQHYAWDSDSGSTNDLDACKMKESFSGDHCDNPPFYNCATPNEKEWDMSKDGGTAVDEQGWKKSKVYGYPPGGDAGWDQRVYFKCNRCGQEDDLSDNTTLFKVYHDSGVYWFIDTDVSMSCPGPTACYNHELIVE